MFDRVSGYLQKQFAICRSWLEQERHTTETSAFGSFSISTNHANLIYAHPFEKKLKIQFQKTENFLNISELSKVLSKIVDANSLRGMKVSWVLSPDHYQLVLQEDLPVTEEEFQSAIRWKLKSIIHHPIDDVVVDKFFIPLQKGANQQKMIMVAVAQRSYLEVVAAQVKKSGLILNKVDIPELALRNITAAYESDHGASALLYWQTNYIELIITRNKEIYLSRKLDFDVDISVISQDVNHHIQKLALEVQRSFDYFQSQWRLSAPTRIFLVAKPIEVDVAALLTTFLAIPVRLLELNDLIINHSGLSREELYRLLPLIGELLRGKNE